MSRPQRRLTKLSTNDIKVLQALRAGPMDPSELYERFSGAYAMSNVLSNGYVSFEKGIYRHYHQSQCTRLSQLKLSAFMQRQ
jgi:hypothetical protein